jgi:hypothetical protein
MYQLRNQKTTYGDIQDGTAVTNIVDAMRFTSEDIDSLRLMLIDLIKKLSNLYIRDRHLHIHDEQRLWSLRDQEKVRNPPASKIIQKKDVIDGDDDIELLFVPIQLN